MRGLSATGRVITSAAAIMVAVFVGFALDPDVTVKTIGLGMAVAVLIDATLVRMVLVPATMTLMGAGELVAAAVARPDPAARRGQHAGPGAGRRSRAGAGRRLSRGHGAGVMVPVARVLRGEGPRHHAFDRVFTRS